MHSVGEFGLLLCSYFTIELNHSFCVSSYLVQVEQAFSLAPIDVSGNIDYKSLCYIITHGDEKEES